MRKLLILLWFLWLIVGVWAQTTSPSASIRFGPTLPSTCNPSGPNVFFKTSATVGLYQCLTLNNWTAVGSGGSSGITIGTTTITSGTTTRVLFDNAGVVGEYSISGTGNVAMTTTPTIATPSFTTGFTIGGAATSRKIMVGNGTNFVPSTETYAVPGTSGNVLTSDGTNWTSATPAGGGITVGTTAIASGTGTRLVYETSGNKFGEITGITSDGASLTALPVAGVITQTSASATAFESGPNGATNPVLRLVNSTASAVNGISVTGRASGVGALIQVLSSATDDPLVIAPKGAGNVRIATTGAGIVTIDTSLILPNSSTVIGFGGVGATNPVFIGTSAALPIIYALNGTQGIRAQFAADSYQVGASDLILSRNAAGVMSIDNSTTPGTLGLLLAGRVVTAKTSDFTVTTAGKSTYFTNSGAAGAVVFTLPTAAVGLPYTVCRDANFLVTVVAGASTTIRVGASVTAAAGNVTLDAVGSCIHLQAISTTQWFGMIVGAVTFN